MKLRLIAAAAIIFSCSFPSVTYEDASLPNDASVGDAPAPDASDGGVTSDAADAADEIDPCDEDNDGYKSLACDGGDCNDHDSRVHPNQNFLPDVPDAAPFGDWNCDGNVELQYPVVTCSITLQCNDTEGFVANENCGQSGAYETCQNLCTKADAGNRTQGCR